MKGRGCRDWSWWTTTASLRRSWLAFTDVGYEVTGVATAREKARPGRKDHADVVLWTYGWKG